MDEHYLQVLEQRKNSLEADIERLSSSRLSLCSDLQEMRTKLKQSRQAALSMQEAEVARAIEAIDEVASDLRHKQESLRSLSAKERELTDRINTLEHSVRERELSYQSEVSQSNKNRYKVVQVLQALDTQIHSFHKKMQDIRDTEASTYQLQKEAQDHAAALERAAYALEIQENNYNRLINYSRDCLQQEYKLLKLKQELLNERELRLKAQEEEVQIQWQQLLQAKQYKNEGRQQNTSD